MGPASKGMLLTTWLAVGGCIDSGNRGWDLGSEPDLAGGASMEQAWRGVHEGRIGFRCRGGQVLLFVETWHPLDVPAGRRIPAKLVYRFDVGAESLGEIEGLATSRGIEIPAPQVGEGAPNSLMRGLTDHADELVVNLKGVRHLISIKFDVEDAAHAHNHAKRGCGQ